MNSKSSETEQLERALREELAKVERSARRTRRVGLAIVLIVALYLTFLYRNYHDVLTPEFAVNLGAQMVQEHLSEARENAVQVLRARLPNILNNLETMTQDSIANLRLKLLDEANRQIEPRAAEFGAEIDLGLHKTLHQGNEKRLFEKFQSQAACNQAAHAIVVDAMKKLESQMVVRDGKNLDQYLQQVLAGPRTILDHLKQLRLDANPSDREKSERELISLLANACRSSAAEAAPEKAAAQPSPPVKVKGKPQKRR
jgi:hypothetical protein